MKIVLTKDQANNLMNLMIDHGVISDEEDFRTDYSGRGMFGASCLGIVVGTSGFASGILFAQAVTEYNEDTDLDDFLDLDWFSGSYSDFMGRSTIIYWPSVVVDGE
jgi:hypothetical protein